MKEEAISILKKYHQEYILEYNLSEKQQQELEKQILSIDFEQLQKLYKRKLSTYHIQIKQKCQKNKSKNLQILEQIS